MKIPLGNDALIDRGQTRVVLTRIRGNLQHYQKGGYLLACMRDQTDLYFSWTFCLFLILPPCAMGECRVRDWTARR